MATRKAKAATPVRTVKCPQCGATVEWGPQSPYRPFCSARCRQLDLGAWASDAYRVPGAEPDPGKEPDEE